ncbi:competence type IV pilus minor pilin ComGG [Bacillus thermotolerans]|uniref:Competence protein ComG n=1 Tax=Bacillus thermotolerans TaxID=1221996 RepID=A0A0F5IC54_BACTR|nr:competence type IV pilus minor pilin ComGG [Bacillus thermotolerans]KKB37272.1 hypothetical protein QY97_00437 [Bacillus thermotolerans]KKB42930.1 hypothetical protein QY95_03037 [Bacillus thermotolerans]KKB43836.1 hypothetical protein QY96_00431 [Bacillus thermotolerans]
MRRIVCDERGVLLPYVLLLFIMVSSIAVFGTSVFVSKQQTASLLADYYETKVMELMVLERILPAVQPDVPVSGIFSTNEGEVRYAAVPNEGEEQVVIHLKTEKKGASFSSKVVYHMTQRQIVQWTE